MANCVEKLNRQTSTIKTQLLSGKFKLGKPIVMKTITEQQRNSMAAIPKSNILTPKKLLCIMYFKILFLKETFTVFNKYFECFWFHAHIIWSICACFQKLRETFMNSVTQRVGRGRGVVF